MAASQKPIPKAVHKRLKALGGTSRQYVDPKTGNIYSRRQYEKGRIRQPRAKQKEIDRKYKQYLRTRDAYIEKKSQSGKRLTKREAMQSDELKKVIKDLRSKNPQHRKRGLEKTIWGDKVTDWTPYIKRWSRGEGL